MTNKTPSFFPKFKFACAALALALFIGTSVLADNYLVSAVIEQDNQVLGTPAMLVKAGQTASMSAGEDYRLSVTLHPQDGGRTLAQAHLDIHGSSMSPSMLINYGETGKVSISKTTLSLKVTPES